MESGLATALGHLKNDVPFPATKRDIVTACSNMSDLPAEDRDWVTRMLPEGRYKSPEEVVGAIMKKL